LLLAILFDLDQSRKNRQREFNAVSPYKACALACHHRTEIFSAQKNTIPVRVLRPRVAKPDQSCRVIVSKNIQDSVLWKIASNWRARLAPIKIVHLFLHRGGLIESLHVNQYHGQ
jgi:hypothetical protein